MTAPSHYQHVTGYKSCTLFPEFRQYISLTLHNLLFGLSGKKELATFYSECTNIKADISRRIALLTFCLMQHPQVGKTVNPATVTARGTSSLHGMAEEQTMQQHWS
jgi:hypothetical protein